MDNPLGRTARKSVGVHDDGLVRVPRGPDGLTARRG